MKHWHQPSGLCSGLAFMVDASWTTEQALAVLENAVGQTANAHQQGGDRMVF